MILLNGLLDLYKLKGGQQKGVVPKLGHFSNRYMLCITPNHILPPHPPPFSPILPPFPLHFPSLVSPHGKGGGQEGVP